MPAATFRFYEELNDFLPPEKRKTDFQVSFSVGTTVGDAIASIGVPHSEVDLILVNGVSADFTWRLEGKERVSVYPVFESFDIGSCRKLGPRPLRSLRFVADADLSDLAALMTSLGFDIVHHDDVDPEGLIEISVREGRVLLTRSRRLLGNRDLTRCIVVNGVDPEVQLEEVFERLDLPLHHTTPSD